MSTNYQMSESDFNNKEGNLRSELNEIWFNQNKKSENLLIKGQPFTRPSTGNKANYKIRDMKVGSRQEKKIFTRPMTAMH